jgi:AbrB family looped-hinge helix DNA binding protein
MKATIDKAGRVVIPASIRERMGLQPGSELEVLVDDLSIRLVRTAPAPVLVRRGKRLVARPTVVPSEIPHIDMSRLVEEERNRWPW